MNDPDGLYLDNVWVTPADETATTYQSNDLTKPTTLQISHSNTFSLPDSLLMRELTGNAEQLDSASKDPYRVITCVLIRSGEVIFSGIAEFERFQNGWDVTLYEKDRDLYDRLERSIRTVDLSRYDHAYTLTRINELAESSDGVCYPIIDNGLLSNGLLPIDSMTPGVYLHTLVGQFLTEEGYRLVGTLPDEPIYKRAVLPFVESEPTNHDQQWQDDRKARVTLQSGDQKVERGALANANFVNRIQPFNIDNRPDDGFTQGRLKNYNTSTFAYVCDSAMRVRVEVSQLYKVSNVTGSVEIILIVEKNGQNVAQEYVSTPGGYNILHVRIDTISLDELISCQKGDQLRIRLIIRRKTRVGDFRVTLYNNPDNATASFTPDLSTQLGDNWLVARNQPDLSCLNILKLIAFALCGTWSVDAFRKEIRFVSFTRIINNVANAVDWSKKINTKVQPSWKPSLPPYAQTNYLRYKETDETKQLPVSVTALGGKSVSVPYGDGIISVDVPTLQAETTLLEMPVAASTNSEQLLPGYGNPVLIRTRSVTGTGDQLSVSRQSTAPRLILVAPELSQAVPTTLISADGLTQTPAVARLKPAWFGVRPQVVTRSDTAYSLCFSPVPGLRGERCLIDHYYAGLRQVLRRVRVLDISVLFTPKDIASLDFERPIRLQRVQVGAQIISDSFWYLNKVSDYQDGQPCTITLIALV